MKKDAFTLIELLVVMSIIAILSAIGINTFSHSRAEARDSIRKRDLNTLATALEIHNQKTSGYVSGVSTCQTNPNPANNIFYETIKPYMANQDSLPTDPITKEAYCYISASGGYRLFTKLENCSDKNIIPGIDCKQSPYNYSVVSDNLKVVAAAGSITPPPPPPPPPTNPFTGCSLSSAAISLTDSNNNGYADEGETVTMNAVFPAATCPLLDGGTKYLQIDAKTIDNSCNIQFSGGNINGITKFDPTDQVGSYSGSWQILTIPDICKGKTVYASRAYLGSGSFESTKLTDTSPADSTPINGSLTFTPGSEGCTGNITLSLSPNPATATNDPSHPPLITFNVSGLSNCFASTIYLKSNSCTGTLRSQCTTTPDNGLGCSNPFNGPPYSGNYDYYSCVDINSETKISNKVTLTVQ